MAEAALRMGADNGDASKRPIYGALAAAALNQDPQKGVGLGLLSKDRGTAAILNGGHFEVRRRRPFDTRLLEAPRAGHADSGTTSSSRPLQGAGETGTDREQRPSTSSALSRLVEPLLRPLSGPTSMPEDLEKIPCRSLWRGPAGA